MSEPTPCPTQGHGHARSGGGPLSLHRRPCLHGRPRHREHLRHGSGIPAGQLDRQRWGMCAARSSTDGAGKDTAVLITKGKSNSEISARIARASGCPTGARVETTVTRVGSAWSKAGTSTPGGVQVSVTLPEPCAYPAQISGSNRSAAGPAGTTRPRHSEQYPGSAASPLGRRQAADRDCPDRPGPAAAQRSRPSGLVVQPLHGLLRVLL